MIPLMVSACLVIVSLECIGTHLAAAHLVLWLIYIAMRRTRVRTEPDSDSKPNGYIVLC